MLTEICLSDTEHLGVTSHSARKGFSNHVVKIYNTDQSSMCTCVPMYSTVRLVVCLFCESHADSMSLRKYTMASSLSDIALLISNIVDIEM